MTLSASRIFIWVLDLDCDDDDVGNAVPYVVLNKVNRGGADVVWHTSVTFVSSFLVGGIRFGGSVRFALTTCGS